MKIIVAHPGQQHSYKLAEAIKLKGCLYRYLTTYYSYEKKRKIINTIPFFNSIFIRAKKRRIETLCDNEVVTFDTFLFYVVALLLRIDKKGNIYRWCNELLSKNFGKKVANYAIKHNVDAVIMYDTTADVCFSILSKKAPNILRIQDVSAINRLYMKRIYEEDMKRSPQYAKKLMRERGFLFERKYYEIWQREIEMSEYFIVPSDIVAQSLIYSGVKRENISICPYGTNFKPHPKRNLYEGKNKFEILYIGNVTQMKGIFYLLDAMCMLDANTYHLTVVGKYDISENVINKYKNRVDFTGYVMHEKVKDYLENADVFVFPSLGDSFGLAAMEAMSYGLPVICSDHAGVSDLIEDGINGFVVPVGSAEIIKEKIEYIKNNPDFLLTANNVSINKARQYSWQNYQKNIDEMVEQLNYIRKEKN